jgi:RNA polymerase sigma factor (sigma-70 family)
MGDVMRDGIKHTSITTSIEHVVYDGDNLVTLGDLLTTPDLDPRQDERQMLFGMTLDFWHRTLKRRERYVIARRYFGEQLVTLTDIGKELGISRERVRQIETIALKKMRRCLPAAERGKP